jgi:fucose permease
LSAVVLFIALVLLKGTIQYISFLVFGILVLAFISGAAAVTQDVIHPGLRATSYAVAVVVQNLLGASTAPIIMGKIYDLTNIQTALSVLPFVLLLGTVLFWLGSRKYINDLGKVAQIKLEAE